MNQGKEIQNETMFQMVGAIAGLLFGAGLVISGMTSPEKVRGFLDFTGKWDPTLIFVMGGAVGVHFFAYRFIRGKQSPLFARAFQVPTRRDIEPKLVIGAAIFGIGWGLGGYCPGPAIVSLAQGSHVVLTFVVGMLASSWVVGKLDAQFEARKKACAETAKLQASSTGQQHATR
ncbi:MAG: YeeE/YedE family protein [Sandaracinaceae bacterium]|nr:YeeE/YedE family protein [Sandaracinaceae bacterium]